MKKTLLTIGLALAASITLNAQSILTDTGDTPAQATARQVLRTPGQTADVILGQLQDGMDRLWGAPDPQAVLDAMGPRAAQVFALNASFAQMVAQLLTQEGDTARLVRLQGILSRIPAHTVHEDGTVTIDPVPEPEPTPEPTPEG